MSLFEIFSSKAPGPLPPLPKPSICLLAQEFPLVSPIHRPVIVTTCFSPSPPVFLFHHFPPCFFSIYAPSDSIAHPPYFPHSISHTNHGTCSLPSYNLYNVSFPNVSPQSFSFRRLISRLFPLSHNSRVSVAVMLRFRLSK